MALSDAEIKECVRRLLLSRMRILCNHGFYGLMLMHMKYAVDEEVGTALTDGERIVFGVDFLKDLNDSELDFIMMHEIMHVVLQHCLRTGERDNDAFNIACDIVVNSNILLENGNNLGSITLRKYGESMHLTPNGDEGHKYTVEQVYEMLPVSDKNKNNPCGDYTSDGEKNAGAKQQGGWDDHSRWGKSDDPSVQRDLWETRLKDAVQTLSIRNSSNTRGLVPAFIQRIFDRLTKPQTDWRTVLNEFVQEEISDYSFCPPDRRFDDGPFFLPDFNEKDDVVEDVLFMIDTSGSMSDEMISAAYSEIKGAIDQFNGRLKGWLGFFDAVAVEPKPFETEDEFKVIKPIGGGGTSFDVIFEYVKEKMQDKPPVSIVILTDGYAPFPAESAAMGIPVLWLINNETVNPPWGKVTRITV